MIFLSLLVLVLLVGCENQVRICKDCNVILISIDSLRSDHLGCYGYYRNTSPNIDSFAREGVVFQNEHSNYFTTLASEMSILSSVYAHFHKLLMPRAEGKLDSNIKTIAEVLEEHNYTTVWSALLDSDWLPLDRGFERGFGEFIDGRDWNQAFQWLRENSHKKFFMYLYSNRVHEPYTPQNSSRQRFTTNLSIVLLSTDESTRIALTKVLQNASIIFTSSFIASQKPGSSWLNETTITQKGNNFSLVHTSFSKIVHNIQWQRVNASNAKSVADLQISYDAAIFEQDEDFGALINTVNEQNLTDNTIIVFTSDHGDEFAEHGGFLHGTLFEEILRVPLIIRGPNIPHGIRVEQLTQSIDIMPTILALIGIPSPSSAQGANLIPLINGNTDYLKNRTIYSEMPGKVAIISDRWKYVIKYETKNGTCEFDGGRLYDLANTSKEQKDMKNQKPEIAKKLQERMINDFRTTEDKQKYSPLCKMPRKST